MKVLVIAEHNAGQLDEATRRAVTAAGQIGTSVEALIAGSDELTEVATALAQIDGLSGVLKAEAPSSSPLAEPLAARIVELVKERGYGAVVAAATSQGKEVVPRVAGLLDMAMISEAITIESAERYVRPIYAGNALASISCNEPVKLVTIRPTAFERAGDATEATGIEALAALDDLGLSTFVGESLTTSERPELTSARVVVAGGRGLGSDAGFRQLEAFADQLGAAVGATRAAVDAGYISNDAQIGQTGKVVAPELYLGIGLSGAIQHVAGMKESKVVVAINKDEEAPIFQVADYGLVGDLFELLPELESALKG